MYIRTTTRRNRDGSTVRYLQLAHNERDHQTGVPQARVLYNFGREETVDRAALARLARSLRRFISPEDALEAQAAGGATALRFLESRPLGGRLGAGPPVAPGGSPGRHRPLVAGPQV